jgi:hypothetical protein
MTAPRDVLEFAYGVRAYPPTLDGEPYWRLRWTEDGRRRDTTAVGRDAALVKAAGVVARLGRGVPTDRGRATGADLVAHYLDPERRPPKAGRWSIRHRDEQARYCERHVLPVLGRLRCSQLTAAHFAQVLAAAATPSVGDHLRRCLSALAAAGVAGGYLLPQQCVTEALTPVGADLERITSDVAVMPDELPPDQLVHDLARAAGAKGPWWRELELLLTAYSGLRFGEHAALLARRVDPARCRVTVAEQVVEAGDGTQAVTMPKGRRRRITVYPETTPCGVDLAGMVERRIAEVGGDGLLFPAARGGWLRRSNFGRGVWSPAAAAVELRPRRVEPRSSGGRMAAAGRRRWLGLDVPLAAPCVRVLGTGAARGSA